MNKGLETAFAVFLLVVIVICITVMVVAL